MEYHYSYRVIFSSEDKEYVGLCAEFPGLSWLSESQEDAFTGIVNLVNETVDDMKSAGEKIPEALADKSYSGNFMVRVPPELHRSLVIQAAKSGMSLNKFISMQLQNSLN